MFPGCTMIHGRPQHSQSQVSVERANQDVQNALITWTERNKCSNWSKALPMVQMMLNGRIHSATKSLPYKLVYGTDPITEFKPKIPNFMLGLADNEDSEQDDDEEEQDPDIDLDNIENYPITDTNLNKNSACPVCNNPVCEAHSCSVCNRNVHVICGTSDGEEGFGCKVICNLCSAIENQKICLDSAKQKSDAQAERMVYRAKKLLSPLSVGQNVTI